MTRVRVFDRDVFDNDIFDTTPPAGVWDERSKQAEVWSATTLQTRVFDPAVFDNSPIFDTGSPAGVWAPKSKQTEIWSQA